MSVHGSKGGTIGGTGAVAGCKPRKDSSLPLVRRGAAGHCIARCGFLLLLLAWASAAYAQTCPTATLPAPNAGESMASFTSGSGISLIAEGTENGESTVAVSGITGPVTRVVVTLNCLSGGNGNGINDYSFLLAAPSGPAFDFLNSTCYDATNATLTLADSESDQAPDGGTACSYGNSAYGYQSYNNGATVGLDSFPDYAGTFVQAESAGTGTFGLFQNVSDPNDTWSLQIAYELGTYNDCLDTSCAEVSIKNWTLTVYYDASLASTTTSLSSSSLAPFTSGANSSVILTATVTSGGGGVNGGTVAFYDGTNQVSCLGGDSVVSGGTASCTTSFATEGTHSLTAVYSGTTDYAGSNNDGSPVSVIASNHTSQSGNSYCNNGTLTSGDIVTTPLPSHIFIGSPDSTSAPTGGGEIDTVSLTLKSLNTGSGAGEEQQNFLLVGPGGQELLFGANGGTETVSEAATNLIFADSGTALAYDTLFSSNTTYQPFSYFNEPGESITGTAAFPGVTPSFSMANEAAPTGTATFGSTYTGAAATGTWSLYYSSTGNGSSTVGGWCADFSMTGGAATSTSVSSGASTSLANAGLTVTATLSDTSSPSTPVSAGTVTFTAVSSGGTVSLGQAAVSGGSAQITVPANTLSEGTYDLVASFADSSNTFGPSRGQAAQRINNPAPAPTVSGNTYTYCSATPILVPYNAPGNQSLGTAAPYPSNINVTNLPGTVNSLGVQLNFSSGFENIQDVASLLTAPNGANIDFFSNVGGFGTAPSDINYLVSDSASNPAIAQTNSSYVAPSGTYPPESFTIVNTIQPDTFPACQQLISNCSSSVGPAAPTSGYNYAATVGSGTFGSVFGTGPTSTLNGSGVWSLYLDSDVANDGGSLGSASPGSPSWCMQFTQNAVTVGITAGHNGGGNGGDFIEGEQNAPITVAVTNSGPGSTGDADGSHPLTVTDTLNSALTYAGYSGAGWSCSAASQTVTCTNDNVVAQGDSYSTLDIDVNVANNAVSSLSNSAQVSGAGVTTAAGNDTITVDPAAVLSVSKSHVGTFTQGQNGEWDIAVANTQTGSVTDGTVNVSDTLPTGYTLANYSGAGWSCSGSSTVSCTSSQGVSGGSSFSTLALTVSVPSDSPASVSNTALAWGGGDLTHTSLGGAASGSDNNVSVTQVVTPTFTWSPPGTIIFGTAGTNVLNATVNCSGCGNITYTATPSSGGTATPITTTSGLTAGSYTITATFTPTEGGYNSASDAQTVVVNGESVWIVDGGGGVSELAGNGAAITSSADAGGTTGAAIDAGGNVWTIGSGTYLLEDISQTGTAQHSIASGGGLDAPSGMAIDGNSQVWVSNAGNNSFSLFLSDGTAVSPSSGFTDTSLNAPSGIAVDVGGSVWIANKGNSTLTRVLGAAAPAAPLSTAAANKTTGAKP
ncbi:MAG TPA: Ig-like domain repeat protein [Acidobacteriaceae bacterium]|jgi:hypothetical protein|nr:Ig-like domain repeat protein [Acidobacteriaceae bacterium]